MKTIGPGECLKPKIGFHRGNQKPARVLSRNLHTKHPINAPRPCMAVPWPRNIIHNYSHQKPFFHGWETKKTQEFIGKAKKAPEKTKNTSK